MQNAVVDIHLQARAPQEQQSLAQRRSTVKSLTGILRQGAWIERLEKRVRTYNRAIPPLCHRLCHFSEPFCIPIVFVEVLFPMIPFYSCSVFTFVTTQVQLYSHFCHHLQDWYSSEHLWDLRPKITLDQVAPCFERDKVLKNPTCTGSSAPSFVSAVYLGAFVKYQPFSPSTYTCPKSQSQNQPFCSKHCIDWSTRTLSTL